MSVFINVYVWAFLVPLCLALKPFETIPTGIADKWTVGNVADPAKLLHLKVVVKNSKTDAFEEHITKIATPFSGHYRKHLTTSQLAEWVKPSQADADAVQHWLSQHGIESKQNHDLILASTTISDAQKLLKTTYHDYEHEDGRVIQRTRQYHVPGHLANIVDLVHPTVNFPFDRQHLLSEFSASESSAVDLADLEAPTSDPCSSLMTTPACLNHLYNATYTAPLSSNITMADWATYGDQPNRTNIEIYLKKFNPLPLKRKDYVLSTAVDGKDGKAEAGDVFDGFLELIMGTGGSLRGMATGLNDNVGRYEWGPVTYDDDNNATAAKEGETEFMDYLHQLAHADGVPSVISQSQYAPESSLSEKYMRYVCQLYGQTAARGISFLQQVADYGSDALPNKRGKVVFGAAFPSSCPWISGVGATLWDRQNQTELAATWQTRSLQVQGKLVALSSGLFSQTFARPAWQNATVPQYVKNAKLVEMYENNPNTTGFNSEGRGLPDFSVIGARIPMVQKGKVFLQNCGVCAAPVAAGFIGRLNAYEQSKGRPLLGALNPFFYQHPEMFTDITCCGTNSVVDSYPSYKNYSEINPFGFPVTKGWDAVTGLGSLQFSKIQQVLDDMAANGALD